MIHSIDRTETTKGKSRTQRKRNDVKNQRASSFCSCHIRVAFVLHELAGLNLAAIRFSLGFFSKKVIKKRHQHAIGIFLELVH